MDVNGVLTNTALGGVTARNPDVGETAKMPVAADAGRSGQAQKPAYEDGLYCDCDRAMKILRQEIKTALSLEFGVSALEQRSAFDAMKGAPSSSEVAAETLGAASRLAGENADVSTYALLKFRQRIQAAAAFTRQTVGADEDIGKVDDAVDKVQKGLDALDSAAARNVESSASILSIESRERQRSTIRIRTQEGDIVRLDVRRSNRLSAQDVAASNQNGSVSNTELAVSSRSRLTLSVKGDLNDAEFAAIQNVFAQAESIANEFYDGDLSAAFSLASNLEFDVEQLSNVNLRFRSREVTTATYGQIRERAVLPPALEPQPAPPPAAKPEEPDRAAPGPVVSPVTADVEPRATDDIVTPAPDPVEPPAQAPQTADLLGAPFLEFFALLTDFLSSVADGFERAAERLSEDAAQRETSAFKFHYSQSFKLQIFKSVLELTAPEDVSDDAGNLAAKLIDGIADAAKVDRDDD